MNDHIPLKPSRVAIVFSTLVILLLMIWLAPMAFLVLFGVFVLLIISIALADQNAGGW